MCVIFMVTRATSKLSALQVKKIKPDPKKTIKLSDGGNLYLRIDPNGNKYWIFHYTRPITSKKMIYHLGAILIFLLKKREKLEMGIERI